MDHLRVVPDDELGEAYPDDYLQCRALRHWWKIVGTFYAEGEIVRALHCARCGCDRHDFLSAYGAKVRPSRYDHPEGYLIAGGVHAVDVSHELLARTGLDEAPPEEAADPPRPRGARAQGR